MPCNPRTSRAYDAFIAATGAIAEAQRVADHVLRTNWELPACIERVKLVQRQARLLALAAEEYAQALAQGLTKQQRPPMPCAQERRRSRRRAENG
jgi:hypothetical protein